MEKEAKKRIFSGVQPTGTVHIGNYLGAIANWVNLQEQYDSIFCIVDYHAITVRQDPTELKQNILNMAKIYLASGINPEKSVIFKQSDVSAHTELAWILNCVARIADLNKMTQFKEKAGKGQESATVGLYAYPVLMAADILLYNTDIVPVGEDQKQHVELAREIAKRFNSQFGSVFKIPESLIRKEAARIKGLDDPMKKMSKSAASPANYISLLDAPEVAAKKIMRAVTDSGSEIRFDEKEKPAISNLINIYCSLGGGKIKEVEQHFAGRGYGDLKKELAVIVSDFLSTFQKKYYSFKDEDIIEMLKQGADNVRPMAENILQKVKEKLGVL